ncbi:MULTISPECIES: sucrase ferredoxin [Cyanophyceae]|uniref:Sucrase ferredoxin n=1 Tax=Leptolyngbya subtilissima DQ-A4 TaxID=2933933 RepID=A0ABV0K926_9CYAN|nr:sucrase ferredoxin [Nodosilinea sp. FACHB-141]
MEQSFCAEQARQSGIDIAGSASEHSLYVAIACSPPWESNDLDSKGIPENLRLLGKAFYDDYDRYQTRFLLIHNDQLQLENRTRVLVFRKPSGLATGYEKQEFHLRDIHDVAPLVQQIVMGEPVSATPVDEPSRDILVCTHGSRDRCCSRFGAPIYHQARKLVAELGLQNTRIWQTSHIGGHRMAPTAIDFPSARYYGYLDAESLRSVLTHEGDIRTLDTIYRGWGLLPWAAQVLEKQLLLTHGWDWLNCAAIAQVIEQDEAEDFNRVELSYKTPGGEQQIYRAEVVADPSRTAQLKGSCASQSLSEITPYSVKSLVCSRWGLRPRAKPKVQTIEN